MLVTRISVVADGLCHRRGADEGLAGAAREHHDARTTGPEMLHCLLLVWPQMPAVLVQRYLVCLSVDVSGQILGRPAKFEQCLLEPATLGRVYRDRVRVDLRAEHVGELLRLGHLDEDGAVGGAQHQAVHRVVGQLQPAVPVHRLGDIDQ